MSETHSPGPAGEPGKIAALFANLVVQQTNLALMMLGRVPNPETGEHAQDLDAARYFIDQLEMLGVKTKGNLDAREDQLLKQSLMTVRLAYVEAVDAKGKPEQPASQPVASQAAAAASEAPKSGNAAETSSDTAASQEESRKKFTKKY